MHPSMLPSWIGKYSGLKFGDRGRGPTEFDCWGLVKWVYQNELGIGLPDYLTYDTVTNDVEVGRTVEAGRLDGWIQASIPQAFDVVMFKIYGKPLHVGLVATPQRFLHAPEEDYSRVEYLTDRHWKNRIEGFYRHVAIPSNR
jgi:probable lipoprotein NlpC